MTLERLLDEHPQLATTGIERPCGPSTTTVRSLLHIATDWPGHFPNVGQTIAVLLRAGADVNARFVGKHTETPLHWAASTDDVESLDALLDGGADIEATGSVIGSSTPLADAVAFGQWRVARRLIERGARANLWQAAALGLIDLVMEQTSREPTPTSQEITNAFWCACHGGQQGTAAWLLERGADLNWVGYDGLTPLDAAHRAESASVVEWLRARGAVSAKAAR
jgi:ankyrin repeat protein